MCVLAFVLASNNLLMNPIALYKTAAINDEGGENFPGNTASAALQNNYNNNSKNTNFRKKMN